MKQTNKARRVDHSLTLFYSKPPLPETRKTLWNFDQIPVVFRTTELARHSLVFPFTLSKCQSSISRPKKENRPKICQGYTLLHFFSKNGHLLVFLRLTDEMMVVVETWWKFGQITAKTISNGAVYEKWHSLWILATGCFKGNSSHGSTPKPPKLSISYNQTLPTVQK